jgi:hypothetical protein
MQELDQLRDVRLAKPGQDSSLAGPEVGDREAVGMVNRLRQHAGVTAARAVGHKLLFQHHYPSRRIELAQKEGGPQSSETAPYDNNRRLFYTFLNRDLRGLSLSKPETGLLDRPLKQRCYRPVVLPCAAAQASPLIVPPLARS